MKAAGTAPCFEAFLEAAALALSRGSGPDVEPSPGELFAAADQGSSREEDPVFDPARTARELRSISPRLYELLVKAWMSEEDILPETMAVVAAARAEGSSVLDDYSRAELRALRGACARVDREVERLFGFARFSPRPDGLYVALLEPDHNLILALMPRFIPRFGGAAFALIDLRRGLAIERRDGRTRGLSGEEILAILPDGSEDEAAGLWRRYYRIIANPDRSNPGLRRRLMPERYWKHLTEMG